MKKTRNDNSKPNVTVTGIKAVVQFPGKLIETFTFALISNCNSGSIFNVEMP